jgi:hypothetical protein
MDMNRAKELLKQAFELDSIKEETYLEGFFSGKATKYYIPEGNFMTVLKEFPFMKNAVKAGLFSKERKGGGFYTTNKILSVKTNDKRKSSGKQFFSINGDDDYERTTLYDILVTLNNLKYISKQFGVKSDTLKFTIRYENGNPEKVMNFVELDKRLFGNNEEEIRSNVKKLNEFVKYERPNINEETANVV